MGKTFFERFSELCKERGETPNSVAKEIGASSGSVTAWKRGTEPRNATLTKLADYFGTTVDYLTCRTDDFTGRDNETLLENNKKPPVLTKKDRRDIAKSLEEIMADLENSGDLMFDGDPMTAEAKESIRSALKLGLEAAKLKNKETYTPKKYRG